MTAAPPAPGLVPQDPRISVGTASTAVENPFHHPPRTVPPWVTSAEARGSFESSRTPSSPTQRPPRAAQAQHNNTPSDLRRRVSKDGYVYVLDDDESTPRRRVRSRITLQRILKGKEAAERGRKWDHLRSAEPVIVSGSLARAQSRSPWWDFVRSSEYGHLPNEESEVVSIEELDKLQPGFNNPVDLPRPLDLEKARPTTRTAALYKRAWKILLKHPLVPLAFRLTVLVTSITAMALSVHIFEIERGRRNSGPERAQAIFAMAVDAVAIPYTCYMTWDEYTGKPLGLRPPTQKISLTLMDLFFIIFKSASTSLAFDTLIYQNSHVSIVEDYSSALTAFQLVSLVSWTMNLTVNVFRLVHRLGGSEDESAHIWSGHG
ncbi:hypothetical protein VTK73DRAFT_1953 [Phialemonium thermophilum]|uniref:Regulator of phospholipase D SRF1 n=1 Tax=Phialemonium thermophilum TaxID=223376 RepID=A0ABR3X784_9PEZI